MITNVASFTRDAGKRPEDQSHQGPDGTGPEDEIWWTGRVGCLGGSFMQRVLGNKAPTPEVLRAM